MFEDGTKVLAKKAGLHYARPFRPHLRIVSAAGHPWGVSRRRRAMSIGTFSQRFGLGPTGWELHEGKLAGQSDVRCAGDSGDGQRQILF